MTQSNIELRPLPNVPQDQNYLRLNKHVPDEASRSARSSITAREPETTKLHGPVWPVVVFLVYAALVLFPWIALCVMSKAPIRGLKVYDLTEPYVYKTAHWYSVNENYQNVAHVLHSIATLITIPVTTAICSMACVAYMQGGALKRGLTLRKSMALADASWLSPSMFPKIILVGSIPLYTAFLLTLLGSIGQISQHALIEQKSVLGTTGSANIIEVTDLTGLLNGTYEPGYSTSQDNFNRQNLGLRNVLESPFSIGDDVHNWGIPYDLEYDRSFRDYDKTNRNHYESAGYTYVPGLDRKFSSGAFSGEQFALRINSSIMTQNITEAEFKQNCRNETENGGFYVQYEWYYSDSKYPYVDFELCMTNDMRTSPWNITRDRQDLAETLYYRTISSNHKMGYWKLTSATSLGYFEVPSEQNGRVAGPLLDKDPFTNDMRKPRGRRQLNYRGRDNYKRADNSSYGGNTTLSWSGHNKGPLASLAIALFGPYSFVETRMSRPSEISMSPNITDCMDTIPLTGIMDKPTLSCTPRSEDTAKEEYAGLEATAFLDLFNDLHVYNTVPALSQGLYLANKLWLGRPESRSHYLDHLKIYYDDGIPTKKPDISQAGIIVGSVFQALHLGGLLFLTVYVVFMKPWEGRMGADVTVKMGMVYADELARSETKAEWERTLDSLPGYIGDERPQEAVGRLRMGAPAALSLRGGRKFEILK